MLEQTADIDRRTAAVAARDTPSRVDGSGERLTDLFARLPRQHHTKLAAMSPDRHSFAVQLDLTGPAGHGRREYCQLDAETFLVIVDSISDRPRHSTFEGDDLVALHLRLSGTLRLLGPAHDVSLTIAPDTLLVLRLGTGIALQEQIRGGDRDRSITLHIRPARLEALARRLGIAIPARLAFALGGPAGPVAHLIRPLDARLLLVAHGLLNNRHRDGLRLLQAEAKALELLCGVLDPATQAVPCTVAPGDTDLRRLDMARRIVTTQYTPPPRIATIARQVGMSETKLKAAFKARFGMTIHDMGIEARMRHALELLRGRRLPVCRVAQAVGYGHQTSFASAFKKHFGCAPRAARRDGTPSAPG